MLGWLDYFPLTPLALAAFLLGLGPFVSEPHLWSMAKRLVVGDSFFAIDILDLIIHTFLFSILALKLLRIHQLGHFELD